MELDGYMHGCTSSPETVELDAAMVKAMREFTAVQQSGENKYAKWKYETYTDLVTATVPYMLKHGVRIAFYPCHRGGREAMVGKIKHSPSGQWESATVDLIYPVNPKNGQVQHDGQGAETADTYARKRLLRSLTACWVGGVEAEVDRVHEEQNVRDMVEDAEQSRSKARPADKAVQSMSYEALAIKAIEGADDAESAKRALDTVELRAREGAIERSVFDRCKERFRTTWEVKA